MAIEINIYTSRNLSTLFVSKADSTGFLSKLSLPKTHTSPVKAISSTFVSYLVRNRQREGKRFVVSLFARAQDQYLFPGSIDNSTKHVLDDRQLVRWWCRVLDPILKEYTPEREDLSIEQLEADDYDESATTSKGYLIVPGVDKYETRRFFPVGDAGSSRWVNGHPLQIITAHPTAPPRCLIPRFPDDPKARYLEELDEEIAGVNFANNVTPSRSNGQWRSIKDLEQFWEMMSYRQECSSGRLVGFIWVVFTPPDLEMDEEGFVADSQVSFSSMAAANSQPAPRPSRRKPSTPAKSKRKKPLQGPIVPRLPRIKSAGNSSSSQSAQPSITPFYSWPEDSRGELVLSQKDYNRAHELLLHQNFGSEGAAARSTAMWIRETGVLAGRNGSWGWTVVGRNEGAATTVSSSGAGTKEGSSSSSNGIDGVQTLDASFTRKKRKADGDSTSATSNINGSNGTTTNVLSGGLVRKKPKVEESSGSTTSSEPNVLSSSLIRKKAKPAEYLASNEAPTSTESKSEPTIPNVNVLGSGLVRKKPKPQ